MSYDMAPVVSTDKFTPGENIGALCLVQVLGYEQEVQTVNGVSPAIRVTVTVIEGPNDAGKTLVDVLWFNKLLVSALRRTIGRMALGRLIYGEAQRGKSAPIVLNQPTPEDCQKADAFIARNGDPSTPEGRAKANSQGNGSPPPQPQQNGGGQWGQPQGNNGPQNGSQGQQQWSQAQYAGQAPPPQSTYTQAPQGEEPPF